MNLRCVSVFLSLAVLLAVSHACSGSSKQQVAELDALIRVSDSVAMDLRGIDTIVAATLYDQSADVKDRFKASVKDTLELAFAEELNAFLKGNKQLHGFNREFRECLAANTAVRKRLVALKADIENGSGDRAKYAEFVTLESGQTKAIRTHCIDLKRRFDTSKSAIEQFQPDIERFISQFVPPAP